MVEQEKDDGWIDTGSGVEVKFYKQGGMFIKTKNGMNFLGLSESSKHRLYHLISENMEGRLIGQEA